MSKKIASAVTKIVEQLEGLQNGEERLRAVSAALTVFGEQLPSSHSKQASSPSTAGAFTTAGTSDSTEEPPVAGIHPRGRAWMSKHGVTEAQLEQFFHIEEGHVQLIVGDPIGRGKREQTINTYVLTGLANYLETGGSMFSDEAGRANCTNLGCYDMPNHAATMKAVGNKLTGSKKGGWTITGPGLTAAAALLRPDSKDKK